MMDDQKADLYGELPAFQKEVLGWYLALRISERNWFLPVATFQVAF